MILLLTLLVMCKQAAFDLNQNNKDNNGTSIYNTQCNKDTQIDFFFSSETTFKADSSTQNITNAQRSSLKFLDITGQDLSLTLTNVELSDQSGLLVDFFNQSSLNFFNFKFTNGNKEVYVVVPITNSNSANDSRVINLNNVDSVYENIGDDYQFSSEFNSLQQLTGSSLQNNGISLDAFNFLNLRDYGFFFTSSNQARTHTILVNAFIYKIPNDISSNSKSHSLFDFVSAANVGDKLCYGSLENEKIFQTHLRESYPLWTAWFAIFFFWLYYLMADAQKIQVYDQRFQNNKWTCWGFYSVHYLAHEDCFTRLSRISQMLLNFTFQGMILAAVYSTLGPQTTPIINKGNQQNNLIIIWAALISLVASLPIPFITGSIFLNRIYQYSLQKYRTIKKSKNTVVNKKQQEEIYEKEIDNIEQKLYTSYYWFYIMVFGGFISFSVASVHMMMQLHRDYYFLHWFWIASLVIVFFLDHLVVDTALTKCFGNTDLYRKRGYFYNFELGQEFQDIED